MKINHLEIYAVSDSRGITGYGATVVETSAGRQRVHHLYFKSTPTREQILRAIEQNDADNGY
jgi:hypothetical protein